MTAGTSSADSSHVAQAGDHDSDGEHMSVHENADADLAVSVPLNGLNSILTCQ